MAYFFYLVEGCKTPSNIESPDPERFSLTRSFGHNITHVTIGATIAVVCKDYTEKLSYYTIGCTGSGTALGWNKTLPNCTGMIYKFIHRYGDIKVSALTVK